MSLEGNAEDFELFSNQGKYLYIAEAAPIENVVFSGGGAKGVVYPGVIKGLQELKIINVAGSSIGAVTAALYSSGMTGKEFKEITTDEKFDFKALLGDMNKKMQKTGEPLLQFLREQIAESIKSTLKQADPNAFMAQYQNLPPEKQLKLHELLGDPEQKNNIINLMADMKISSSITFSMLDVLREFNDVQGIDGAFKNLSVTSVCKDDGELKIFNANNTPDLEIALACRASASLPVILAPVSIPNKDLGIYSDGKTGSKQFVDGGYLDNIPSSAVDSAQKKERGVNLGEQGQNLQTLVFIFDETKLKKNEKLGQSPYLNTSDFTERELYEPNLVEKIIRNLLPRILSSLKTKTKATVAKARGLKQVSTDYTQRNVPLKVSGIRSTDFDKAKELANGLIKESKLATKNYIALHRNEAIYLSYDNPTSLLLAIPGKALKSLMDNGEKEKFGIDLERISQFRDNVSDIFKHLDSRDMKTNLKALSEVISRERVAMDVKEEPYSDYVADLLHADQSKWKEVLTLASSPYTAKELNADFIYAIKHQEASDYLMERKKELYSWVRNELNQLENHKKSSPQETVSSPQDKLLAETNKVNESKDISTLKMAQKEILAANTFEDLKKATESIKNNYPAETKKLSLLNLFRKSSTTKTAEKHVAVIENDSLQYDGYLRKQVALEPSVLNKPIEKKEQVSQKKEEEEGEGEGRRKSEDTSRRLV